jgi:lipopolysaccharide biosynthesis glycosyltransferase
MTLNNTFNILYVSNSKFASIVATSIASYLNHNNGNNTYFYIAETDFTSDDKCKIQKLVESYKAKVKFINCEFILEKIEMTKVNKLKGNYIAYIRLFMGEFLPKDIDKVLYLDADTIIVDSIERLFELDMKDKILAGAKDHISKKYKDAIGYEGSAYINSGVLLVNLCEWRKQACGDKIFKMMTNYNLVYQFHDQDIINLLFHKDIILIESNYCVFLPLYSWDADIINKMVEESIFTNEELKSAINRPYIIHMTGTIVGQPWIKGNINCVSKEWIKYLKKTEFYETFEKWENNNSLKWKFFNLILYRIIPFSIWIRMYEYRFNKIIERKIKNLKPI